MQRREARCGESRGDDNHVRKKQQLTNVGPKELNDLSHTFAEVQGAPKHFYTRTQTMIYASFLGGENASSVEIVKVTLEATI